MFLKNPLQSCWIFFSSFDDCFIIECIFLSERQHYIMFHPLGIFRYHWLTMFTLLFTFLFTWDGAGDLNFEIEIEIEFEFTLEVFLKRFF